MEIDDEVCFKHLCRIWRIHNTPVFIYIYDSVLSSCLIISYILIISNVELGLDSDSNEGGTIVRDNKYSLIVIMFLLVFAKFATFRYLEVGLT
jgi:hypothetical protein